jgi:hypothetical protein
MMTDDMFCPICGRPFNRSEITVAVAGQFAGYVNHDECVRKLYDSSRELDAELIRLHRLLIQADDRMAKIYDLAGGSAYDERWGDDD